MSFQVTIIFGLRFMCFFCGPFGILLCYFYYDRLIEILIMGFLRIMNFRFQTSKIGLQTSNFRNQNFSIYLFVKWKHIQRAQYTH